MVSRKLIVNIHLGLAAFFMPLMLMMPMTGTLYLLGFKGEQTTTEVFRIEEAVPLDEKGREDFFRDQLSKNGIIPNFEYVRATKTDFTLRPSTRIHYIANQNPEGQLVVSRAEPNLLKRMIELHKGHGPQAMKWFEVAFGIALIITTLSGLWLAWTVKAYRTIALSAFAMGLGIIVFCLI